MIAAIPDPAAALDRAEKRDWFADMPQFAARPFFPTASDVFTVPVACELVETASQHRVRLSRE